MTEVFDIEKWVLPAQWSDLTRLEVSDHGGEHPLSYTWLGTDPVLFYALTPQVTYLASLTARSSALLRPKVGPSLDDQARAETARRHAVTLNWLAEKLEGGRGSRHVFGSSSASIVLGTVASLADGLSAAIAAETAPWFKPVGLHVDAFTVKVRDAIYGAMKKGRSRRTSGAKKMRARIASMKKNGSRSAAEVAADMSPAVRAELEARGDRALSELEAAVFSLKVHSSVVALFVVQEIRDLCGANGLDPTLVSEATVNECLDGQIDPAMAANELAVAVLVGLNVSPDAVREGARERLRRSQDAPSVTPPPLRKKAKPSGSRRVNR